MRTLRHGGTLLAATTLLCVMATPANSTTTPEPRADSDLTLLIQGPGADSKGVALRCDPAGGNHPDPQTACDALDKADGDFDQLKSGIEPFACTMELRQVTAIAVGTWEGETVRWHGRFSNPCVLRAETGPVFDF